MGRLGRDAWEMDDVRRSVDDLADAYAIDAQMDVAGGSYSVRFSAQN